MQNKYVNKIGRIRYPHIDSLRGLAIIFMVAFHFSFDLNQFGVIHQNFYEDSFWLNARIIIVTLFLSIVGISLVLAASQTQAQKKSQYWRRIIKLLVCASLVTVGSMLMFPESYIFFGVLHFILIASLLAILLLPYAWFNLVLGLGVVLMGVFYTHPVFNHPWLQWLGMMTYKPITEDYVPLFPWLGVVLIGMFIAKLMMQFWSPVNEASSQAKPQSNKFVRYTGWLGRRSLLIYMIHQPILMAGLSVWAWLLQHS